MMQVMDADVRRDVITACCISITMYDRTTGRRTTRRMYG